MSKSLLFALALSLPLMAQGVYDNAAKPGDPICAREVIDRDPTVERHALSDSNPSAALTYQQVHQFIAPGQRKDVSAFKAYDEKKKGLAIADLKGKIVVVGFWSTHCDPSARMLMEMAELEANKNKFGFEMVAINFDGNDISASGNDGATPGGWVAVGKFKMRNREFFLDHPLPIYLAGTGAEGPGNFMNAFNSMPAMFVIDPEGKLASMDIGYTPKLVAMRLSQLIRERQAAKAAGK